MDFQDLIRCRYSVRAYTHAPVEKEKLEKVLEAGRLAPTAANLQPIGIVVVETAGRKDELQKIYGRDWFVQAPLLLCVCSVPEKAWVRRADGWNAHEVDAAIVMDHLILAAAEQGLGTCWIAHFDVAAAREALKLPEGVVPMLFSPLGYAADQPKPKKRAELGALVHFEKW